MIRRPPRSTLPQTLFPTRRSSNLLNIAGILGLAALIAPTAVHPAILGGDLRWMLALSALLLPIMWWRATVSRLEGGLLLGLYGTYLALLVFGA